MNAELEYTASAEVQAALSGLDRTEDLMFSPSNRRLAVAGFRLNRIAVLDVAISGTPGQTRILLSGVVEIEAPTLCQPHGLCFLDEDTLAVANRNGQVQIFEVPQSSRGSGKRIVSPRQTIAGGPGSEVRTPGSVAAFPIDADTVELLVCNNYSNNVSRHVLDRRTGYAAVTDELFLKNRLNVPDGICFSPDGRWVAISNHKTHSALLFERTPALHAGSEPVGVLRNVLCPHGLRFTADQRHILVADAAARFINVYERGGDTWNGTREPLRLFPIMEPKRFMVGRHNPEEGGPKGIDIDTGMRVLASTCETQTLAFFDLPRVLHEPHMAPQNRLRRFVQWRIAQTVYHRTGYLVRGAA